MILINSRPDPNPLAAMMGGGGKKDPDESHRNYGLGGAFSHRFANGGSLRLWAQTDTQSISKSTLLYDPRGDNRIRVTGQLASAKTSKSHDIDWALTTTFRGVDFAATLRGAYGQVPAVQMPMRGLMVGTSYHQRLAPGSPITLGGEVWWTRPLFDIGERGRGREGGAGWWPHCPWWWRWCFGCWQ